MSELEPQKPSSSRLIRSPLDFGVIVSVIGLLLTITINIVTMYERVTRIETRMEDVKESMLHNEQIADTVNDNQGELRVLNYRLNELEERMRENDGSTN